MKTKKAKAPEIKLLPPGTILAEFVINERAVPWKAPTITRRGGTPKDPRLIAWQQLVFITAANSRVSRKLYEGPAEVEITVSFLRGPWPDLTNCQKAIEDSLQGSVIANDRKVSKICTERDFTKVDRVFVKVTAA